MFSFSHDPKRRIALRLASVVLIALVAAGIMNQWSRKPDERIPVDGRLPPCPDRPNCVSSQSDDPRHHMEPLPFSGSAAEAMESLLSVVRRQPRATIVRRQPGYLRIEFRSLVFRFVDDVEFVIDEPAGVIHFRSASRVGYSDLGVNRRRMERIRSDFQALKGSS